MIYAKLVEYNFNFEMDCLHNRVLFADNNITLLYIHTYTLQYYIQFKIQLN